MKTETASRIPSPTSEIIKGDWNIIKGKLKQQYGTLTDNDLTYVEGQETELLGRLQKRTGRTRRELEKFIQDSCECD